MTKDFGLYIRPGPRLLFFLLKELVSLSVRQLRNGGETTPTPSSWRSERVSVTITLFVNLQNYLA
jgi:hypothetical protein